MEAQEQNNIMDAALKADVVPISGMADRRGREDASWRG